MGTTNRYLRGAIRDNAIIASPRPPPDALSVAPLRIAVRSTPTKSRNDEQKVRWKAPTNPTNGQFATGEVIAGSRGSGSNSSVSCVGCTLSRSIAWAREGKAKMQASEVARAVAATRSTASALDLTVDDVIVLQDSNRLVLRLMPCDVVARVAPRAYQASAEFEVEVAQRLAETESPVAALEPRVEPRVHVRDGFVVNLWTYYEPAPPREIPPADYAHALERLHAGMRQIDLTTPHFTDRVAEAQQLVASRHQTPALVDADRELLTNTLRSGRRAIGERGAAEQVLHGEPHPGNVLSTKNGPVFIDLETCCRGPVEFDLAHVPEEVSERYPDADQELLRECRILVLAMVAAWRWDPRDQFPNGQRAARELLNALREGPPYPALDTVMRAD